MTPEEFAVLTTGEKWAHINVVMAYIANMDRAYNMRVRLNPHHPVEHQKQEERNVRLDQFQRWSHVKDLYAAHRDELANTLDNERYQECRSIMERIFTTEVDDALRGIVDG